MVLKTKSEPCRSLFPFLLFPSYNNEIESFSLLPCKPSSMTPQNPSFLLLLLLVSLFLASTLQFCSSLDTVVIIETSNQTHICALSGQTSLICTTFPLGIQSQIQFSNTTLSGITAGDDFLCSLSYPSLTSNTSVVCWSFPNNGTDLTYKRIYYGAMLTDLDSRSSHICGIVNGSNSLVCWQWPGFSPPNLQNLLDIAVGEEFVCGLFETGLIRCFGTNKSVVGKEPAGNYRFITAGLQQVCAISMDGTLVNCWGQMPPVNLTGRFNSLALGGGGSSGCAIRANYTVFCWGENNFTLPESLQRVYFLSITGQKNVFCGVLMQNYSLICWGGENLGSNYSVALQTVMPGPCQTSCQCGMMPDYQQFCSQGYICLTCRVSHRNRPILSPASAPALPKKSPSPTTTSMSNEEAIAFLVVGCLGSVALLSVFCFFLYQYCKRKVRRRVYASRQGSNTEVHQQAWLTQIHPPDQEPSIKGYDSLGTPKQEQRLSNLVSMGCNGKLEIFALEELRQATDNFSDGHKIGCGSYGSVYRATLQDGREVAIKRAELMVSNSPYHACVVKRQEDKDHAFLSELAHLSRLNHKNLVQLYGYCEEANERVLVYEFMVNGTLHDHIHNFHDSSAPAKTSWACRIKVALDAARGIEYLHTYAVPQIIHRDIKSPNILLNAEWIAKVSDFGLSLMGPDDEDAHISLRAAGTVGYMDPAYYKFHHLTTKSDVYSFGVVLLELLSGFKVIHKNEETGLPTNVVHHMVPYIIRDEIYHVLDPKLPPPTPCEIEAVAYVGYLAADCVVADGRDRPTMTEIVDGLERALASCVGNPFLSRSTTGSTIGDIV